MPVLYTEEARCLKVKLESTSTRVVTTVIPLLLVAQPLTTQLPRRESEISSPTPLLLPHPLHILSPVISPHRNPHQHYIISTTITTPKFVLWGSIHVGIAQSVQHLATGWTVRGSNTGGSDIFPHPSKPALGPTQWLPGLFPGDEVAGAWR